VAWAREAIERGAGELLVNSIDADGTKQGFDLELVAAMRELSSVPVIASGGAGLVERLRPASRPGADAVLAASVFHNGELTVGQVKDALRAEGVRCDEHADETRGEVIGARASTRTGCCPRSSSSTTPARC
jgi:cyclase